uniref:Reverse transcriptase Ty1/copia-type domain-containing protein n=1 Tax=Tanacetum cinerariifolium TaxID=118510 RepID=A0A699I1B3_TANCI|nr:hypothetical protein [Tanacetum cinerariifolium]
MPLIWYSYKLRFQCHELRATSDKTNKHDDKTKKEAKRKSHVELLTGVRNLNEEFEDFSDNSISGVNAASTPVTTVGQNSTNSTNTFSTVGPSNTAVSPTLGKYSYEDPSQYPNDLDMPALEDITYSDDKEDVGTEADISNLETYITVSPIPITRFHKDHPVTQIIDDLSLAPQTRSMTRMVKEQGGLTQITNDDFYTCMFACFLSQEEPKRVHQALNDPSWIEAMREELLQFKMQKVWVLVDLPKGHTQEEGIDYEEVFALVARIESIRLFLAYASFMGFMVYQMDVKSSFLYGTIEEEVYFCQPLGFEDPDYPDKVYKVVKALYRLHQALGAWYETLANYLLENGFQRGKIDQTLFIKKQKDRKSVSTPIDTEKPLLKDPDGEEIVVATSSTEAEYVVAVNCCAQVLWIQNYLVRNVDRSSKFFMYPRFLQLMINAQVGDLSSHTTKYTSPAITQKVFANMRRVGKGFSEVDTPLFKGMLVPQQVPNDVADADVKPTPPSPTPATSPPTQQELIPSSSQVKSTPPPSPHQSLIAPPSSPPPQQPPSHDAVISINLLNQLLETCVTLTKKERLEESQAHAYHLDLEHAQKVLSMQDDEVDPAELKEVSKVVTTAKLMTEVVTAAATTITATPMPKASAARGRKLEKEASKVIKRKSETSVKKAAKKQKLDEEVEELKTHLQIVHNDEDDVYTEATPLALKSLMLRKFDKEDLEMLWKIIQERFASSEPKRFSNDFLLNTLKTMFEKPDVEANIWKSQRGSYGLAKFKS